MQIHFSDCSVSIHIPIQLPKQGAMLTVNPEVIESLKANWKFNHSYGDFKVSYRNFIIEPGSTAKISWLMAAVRSFDEYYYHYSYAKKEDLLKHAIRELSICKLNPGFGIALKKPTVHVGGMFVNGGRYSERKANDISVEEYTQLLQTVGNKDYLGFKFKIPMQWFVGGKHFSFEYSFVFGAPTFFISKTKGPSEMFFDEIRNTSVGTYKRSFPPFFSVLS